MNQLDIEAALNELLMKAESDLEKVFTKRLQTILFSVSEMYRKYEKNGELSFTDLNKQNRFQKEMKLIADTLSKDYSHIIKTMQSTVEQQYVAKYLMTAYLVEMGVTDGTEMGFDIPSLSTVKQILLNPISELTLPKIMEQHRNDIVRKINIEISQGLIAGEGYSTIAKRLEKQLGFSAKKAKLVARTEAGRSRSIAAEKVLAEASKYAKMTKVWASMLDHRVRMTHRKLDGKEADKDGLFHHMANKTTAPRLWVGPDSAALSIQCRCVLIMKVNGKLPEQRRERDYMDDKYQQKLADKIDKLMHEDDMTYVQALKKAQKEITPPSRVIPYVSYEDWAKGKG